MPQVRKSTIDLTTHGFHIHLYRTLMHGYYLIFINVAFTLRSSGGTRCLFSSNIFEFECNAYPVRDSVRAHDYCCIGFMCDGSL